MRKELGKVMGKEFVKSADEDETAINKVVSFNLVQGIRLLLISTLKYLKRARRSRGLLN